MQHLEDHAGKYIVAACVLAVGTIATTILLKRAPITTNPKTIQKKSPRLTGTELHNMSKEELLKLDTSQFIFACDVAPGNSPLISGVTWGRIHILTPSGWIKTFPLEETDRADIVITPEDVHAWDWRKCGTKHSPGIAAGEIQENIIDSMKSTDLDTIILTQGMQKVLEVPQTTIDAARSKAQTVEVLQSIRAAERYNDLVQKGKRVAMLFHTTC